MNETLKNTTYANIRMKIKLDHKDFPSQSDYLAIPDPAIGNPDAL